MTWQPIPPETYATPITAAVPSLEVVFGSPGYTQPPAARNPLATTALVLGLIGLPIPIASVGAIVCGHRAMGRSRESGRALARGGLGLGYASLVMWGMLLLTFVVISV